MAQDQFVLQTLVVIKLRRQQILTPGFSEQDAIQLAGLLCIQPLKKRGKACQRLGISLCDIAPVSRIKNFEY
ncbi:hypothetical protein [Ferribacterium limneticum]|uniref:hypothetical protein n=1 Tax=Ferribacterium limneticum TaxID=76259 RepID=UPI001CF912E6|nr:hypothetical protein [Ferribacterium limneticum]UCV24524.1 hypothetical protein KI613_08460 [Ferribacterium limneticum]